MGRRWAADVTQRDHRDAPSWLDVVGGHVEFVGGGCGQHSSCAEAWQLSLGPFSTKTDVRNN